MNGSRPTAWISIAVLAILLASGCQCFPTYDCYANAVDDASDKHIYFDRFYNPRFDLTRMGKPDWAGPINRFLCPRCSTNGTYKRCDNRNLYPFLTPYDFPSNVMPPPKYRMRREPKAPDDDDMEAPTSTSPLPTPGAVSSPQDDQ